MADLQRIRDEVLEKLKPYGVKRIALFGSIARGEETPESDIDILVELRPPGERPPIGLKWFGLEQELSRCLGREVELVSAQALSPYIRPYVEREMVVLYEER